MMTQEERALVRQLIEKVNRLEKRLSLQETIEQGAGGGGSYTNEQAQDAVGNILTDTATVDFTYNDAANTISAIVPDNAITNAKLADMATATIRGRVAAGTGDPQDLTAAQLVTLIEAQALYLLLAGRSGGQTARGDTASGGNLTLMSTAHATKGKLLFGISAYDELNDRLGIGATDPIGELEVVSTDAVNINRGMTTTQINTGAQGGLFNFMKARGTRASKTTVANGDFSGVFFFNVFDGANYLSTAAIGARVVGTVAAGSAPTDIIFGTGAAHNPSLTNEVMRVKSTGLLFAGANQSPLNWYEEGPWTPTLTFGGLSTGITYSGQGGRFVRINKWVQCWGGITLTNKGSAVGTASIGVLPYASASITGLRYVSPIFLNGVSYVGTAQVRVGSNASSFTIDQVTEAGALSSLTNTNFSNSSNLEFVFSYVVP